MLCPTKPSQLLSQIKGPVLVCSLTLPITMLPQAEPAAMRH